MCLAPPAAISDWELREIARPGLIDDRQNIVNSQQYVRPCSRAKNEDSQRKCSESMRRWQGRVASDGIPLIPAFSRQGSRAVRASRETDCAGVARSSYVVHAPISFGSSVLGCAGTGMERSLMAEGKARLEGKVAIVTGAGSSGPGYGDRQGHVGALRPRGCAGAARGP